MQELIEQEKFEIEVLERLNSECLLDALVFGGGTMLRLCHGLNRYSVDLDFWFRKKIHPGNYFKKMKHLLENSYQITDAHEKFFTLLFEFRSPKYPRRMKIEIRKGVKDFSHQPMIAFSSHSNIQVRLEVLTLEQMMRNKIDALLDRGQIRDCFDLEFILRRGTRFEASRQELNMLIKKIELFKEKRIYTSLNSLLEKKDRINDHKNAFQFLREEIQEKMIDIGPKSRFSGI